MKPAEEYSLGGKTPQKPATAATRPSALASATANRASMPTVAAVVDALRRAFGPARVIFAREGDHLLGRPPPPGVLPAIPHVPTPARSHHD